LIYAKKTASKISRLGTFKIGKLSSACKEKDRKLPIYHYPRNAERILETTGERLKKPLGYAASMCLLIKD
jgi:hypothetical protein